MRNNNFNNGTNNNSNNNEFNFGGIVMMNGTITTKEAFVGTVKSAMEAMYAEGYIVRVQEVQKNNGLVLNGLTIQKTGVNIAPTIYLDSFYEDYRNGRTLKSIVAAVSATYEQHKIEKNFSVDMISDFDSVKDKICFKLINAEKNQQILKDIPYVEFMDLAVVFYILVDQSIEGNATALIRNGMMQVWGNPDVGDIYEIAKMNTQRLFRGHVASMLEVMSGIIAENDCLDPDLGDAFFSMDVYEDNFMPMFVATNKSSSLKFDYYYGAEAEQFSFYRVPRLLIKDECFKDLSSDAKLLYGLMLDRMSLSMKNGWFDNENRAYIHYTVENIMEDLGCARATCAKIIAELDSKKGIGLIEKKRQGLGKPDIIYVKNFVAVEPDTKPEKTEKEPANTDVSTEVQNLNVKKFNNQTSRSSKSELQEIQKTDFQRFNNQTSGSSENELAEVQESNSNYNNNSYTDISYNNPINQSGSEAEETMDGMDDVNVYIEIIKENIEYEHYMKYGSYKDKGLYEELFEIICEVVCVKHKTVKIGKDDYPYELVKSKFLKLNSSHLEYVIRCMQNTTTKINNIKAYMVTALYNAPSTINHYYQQEVQHDMFGGGWIEKHYTEDSLLSAMERAGSEDMDDDVERKGLGTPATRADIIEKLVKDGFVKREKKQMIPTEDGMKLITVLPDVVKSPKLTAAWENALTLVAKGEMEREDFMADIVEMVEELIHTYHEVSDEHKKMFAQEQVTLGQCPNCGGQVAKGKYGAYCTSKCGMNVSRIMGVALSDEQVTTLLAGKKILLKGLTSKAGKKYDAYIIPTGTEEYHYTKDGKEKSGVQFKFVMEFAKRNYGKGKKK